MQVNIIKLPEWKQLLDEGINWKAGTTHSHEEISEIMNVKVGTKKYYNHLKKAKEKLTEFGIRIKNIHNEGYRVLLPDEWVTESIEILQKGDSDVNYAHRVLSYAPVSQMTYEYQHKYGLVLNEIIKSKTLLAGGVVSVKTLARPILKVINS